jgi:hypothetical protein
MPMTFSKPSATPRSAPPTRPRGFTHHGHSHGPGTGSHSHGGR